MTFAEEYIIQNLGGFGTTMGSCASVHVVEHDSTNNSSQIKIKVASHGSIDGSQAQSLRETNAPPKIKRHHSPNMKFLRKARSRALRSTDHSSSLWLNDEGLSQMFTAEEERISKEIDLQILHLFTNQGMKSDSVVSDSGPHENPVDSTNESNQIEVFSFVEQENGQRVGTGNPPIMPQPKLPLFLCSP